MNAPTGHASQCSYHCDQYPHECDCGATRPATIMWAGLEVSAAEHAVERAQARLDEARKRLREFEV